MTKIRKVGAHMAGLALAVSLLLPVVANAGASQGVSRGTWIVGTWYLALDSQPFGLPPGFPLSGMAIFNQDGSYEFEDGGDFGQATFLNTRNLTQFGAWRVNGRGQIKGTALSLEADLSTGEVLRWARVEVTLERTDDRNVVTGSINVSTLECANMLPVPTPLTCPDPIESAGDFVPAPPNDVPLTLRRLRPNH